MTKQIEKDLQPSHYLEGVERVSSIVEYKYPFGIEDKTRFIEWLWKNHIKEEEYMYIATSRGTNIHKALEEHILGHKPEIKEEVKEEIVHGIEWINDLQSSFPSSECFPEMHIIDEGKRFQGTLDLVRINGNKVFLYDYKSYEVTKKKYGMTTKLLKSGVPGKPTSKIKKVSLQLSLYAQYFLQKGYEIGGLYLVWLHHTGAHEYKCELWEQEEIDKLIFNFLTKEQNMENIEIDIKAPLKIRLQSAPIAYSAIEVTLDLAQLDSGQTAKEAINEAVTLHKTLHNLYSKTESVGE